MYPKTPYFWHVAVLNSGGIIPGYSTDHIFGYINYKIDGGINYKHSWFTFIKFLNKQGTKIKFGANNYRSNHPSDEFIKDSINIYVLPSFKPKSDWIDNYIRMVRYSNWNDVVFDVRESDYIHGKINLVVSPVLQHKIKKKYKSRDAIFIQLKKGDISKRHNIHGILRN